MIIGLQPLNCPEAICASPTPDGNLGFVAKEGSVNYLYRSDADGSARRKATDDPILEFSGFSPDGRWVVASAPFEGNGTEATSAVLAYPVEGGSPVEICITCAPAWPPDIKSIYFVWDTNVYGVLLPPGRAFPRLTSSGLQFWPPILASNPKKI